jgi:hypothetical protein
VGRPLKETSDAKALEAAFELQGLASESDWAFCQVGIPGTKWFLQKTRGYGGVPRLPILPFDEKAKGEWLVTLQFKGSLKGFGVRCLFQGGRGSEQLFEAVLEGGKENV